MQFTPVKPSFLNPSEKDPHTFVGELNGFPIEVTKLDDGTCGVVYLKQGYACKRYTGESKHGPYEMWILDLGESRRFAVKFGVSDKGRSAGKPYCRIAALPDRPVQKDDGGREQRPQTYGKGPRK